MKRAALYLRVSTVDQYPETRRQNPVHRNSIEQAEFFARALRTFGKGVVHMAPDAVHVVKEANVQCRSVGRYGHGLRGDRAGHHLEENVVGTRPGGADAELEAGASASSGNWNHLI